MPIDFIKLFTNLGLTGTETKIYLASLNLGPTSVQDIAKKAGLSRTAAYEAIAHMQERGFMATYERGKKKFYVAEDPERVASYFKESITGLKEGLEAFNRAIPDLKAASGGQKPKVRFYEGREALHAPYADVHKVRPKEFLEVTNLDDVYNVLDEKLLKEARNAVDISKTKLRILYRGQIRNVRSEKTEFCELDPKLGEFHGDIWIYHNRVVFINFVGKIMTVIMENKNFADTARVLFNSAWNLSKARTLKKTK